MMKIKREILDEIVGVFSYIQVINMVSVQFYDPAQEFRQFCVFAIDLKPNDCTSVHVNINKANFTPWRKKTFEKRSKKIPFTPFYKEFPEHDIIRIGFK